MNELFPDDNKGNIEFISKLLPDGVHVNMQYALTFFREHWPEKIPRIVDIDTITPHHRGVQWSGECYRDPYTSETFVVPCELVLLNNEKYGGKAHLATICNHIARYVRGIVLKHMGHDVFWDRDDAMMNGPGRPVPPDAMDNARALYCVTLRVNHMPQEGSINFVCAVWRVPDDVP